MLRRLLGRVRQTLVDGKDAIEGRLHPRRRARAEERLAGHRPTSVLFVCLGNICRSPYGERALARRLRGVSVRSAGFIGPGRAPPEAALAVARDRGLEHSDHRSQLVTEELMRSTDVVFFFDRFNQARLRALGSGPRHGSFWLGDFDPLWSGKRAIPDPWGKPRGEFERTFERIDRCIEEVVRCIEEAERHSKNTPRNH